MYQQIQGEDTIVVCPDCEYGANIEAATRKNLEVFDYSLKSEEFETKKLKQLIQKLLKKLQLF